MGRVKGGGEYAEVKGKGGSRRELWRGERRRVKGDICRREIKREKGEDR